jgi:hypothetical protein
MEKQNILTLLSPQRVSRFDQPFFSFLVSVQVTLSLFEQTIQGIGKIKERWRHKIF